MSLEFGALLQQPPGVTEKNYEEFQACWHTTRELGTSRCRGQNHIVFDESAGHLCAKNKIRVPQCLIDQHSILDTFQEILYPIRIQFSNLMFA
jgi:hypothetical protein